MTSDLYTLWPKRLLMAVIAAALMGNVALQGKAIADTPIDPSSSRNYKFKMIKGKGQPVCEDRLIKLRTTLFKEPPYCHPGQPLNGDEQPKALTLEPMSAQELFNVLGPGWDYITEQKPNPYNVAHREYDTNGNLVYDPAFGLITAQKLLQGAASPDVYWFKAFWLKEPISIANDGAPRKVMVWQGAITSPAVCYDGWYADPYTPSRIQAYAFVMKSDGRQVDYQATKNQIAQRESSRGLHDTHVVGNAIDIFEYSREIYTESFRNLPLDLRQKSLVGASRQLEVFKRKNDRTTKVCEYLVLD